ncbi:MAG: fatty acid desaturase [Pseudomonadota bacterium]
METEPPAQEVGATQGVLKNERSVEWPTLLLLTGCYLSWGITVFGLAAVSIPVAVLSGMAVIALHSSLTHEAVHGHPFQNEKLNEALLFPALGLVIPYRRFRDLHLAHHVDSRLTDPYDDPETCYLDPEVWAQLSPLMQAILTANNTLAGRLILGPAIALFAFVRGDIAAMRSGDRSVRNAWLIQIPAALIVLMVLATAPMPLWAYLFSCYGALSILKIRTFLEHRAHERANGRTVVIEDRGPLAFIFLNNNLHAVHHAHPRVAWYNLPGIWAQNRDGYLRRNEGYYYRSYAEVFARYFWRGKEPVAHPLWRKR